MAAVVGWFTNFLAIKMLFHPRRPLPLPGLKIQGLLPRRRAELAERIGTVIAEEILSAREISGLLGSIRWRGEVERIVSELVSVSALPLPLKKIPGVDLLVTHLRDHLSGKILAIFEENREVIVARFHDELDIRKLVVERLSEQDLEEIEGIALRLMSRELRHIELIGGCLGFAAGTIQSLLFYLFSR